MTTSPLRAGIIGLGVGSAHAKGYTATPNTTLAAICDADPARLQKLADQYHMPTDSCFTDYKQMLTTAKLDIVSVCLPNYLHADVTIEALNAGLNVLCEKPMALSVAQAEKMIAVAAQKQRRLAIAYNHRYRADVAWMKKMIKSGRLGKIHHVHAAWRRETGIPGSGWFGKKDLSGGGPLIDLGVHVLDMTMHLLDFPKVVTVSGGIRSVFGGRGLKTWNVRPKEANAAIPFDVEDGATGFLRFENDITAFLEATWGEHRQPGDDLIHLEIQGSDGTLVLHIPNYRREDTLSFYTEIEGEPVTVTPKVNQPELHGHIALIVGLVEALNSGKPLPTEAWQGLRTVQVLQAMYDSAKTGREVVIEQTSAPRVAQDNR